MLIGDILHSCANDRVAEAAIASIGGDFARRLSEVANRCDLSAGALAGMLVRRFAVHANERDWRRVSSNIGGEDLPVLRGLQVIVESMLASPAMAAQLAALAPDWDEVPALRMSSDGPLGRPRFAGV